METMGSDSYRVEILHYLHPHLLWVEVTNSKDFIFEQIGVYGVLPQEVTLNGVNLEVTTRNCEKWLPAAFLTIKKTLDDAAEVWFSPTFIDRRSSIFDDNIHKYGEIVVKKKNGKVKVLSQQLIKSGFAVLDTGLFHQELSAGNLKTRLNTNQIQDVIRHLEKLDNKPKKEWEIAVKEKTTVFHNAHTLKSLLTIENLKEHEEVQLLVQNKIKDFDRCKDVDEESIGRAMIKRESSRNEVVPQNSNKKKLEFLKNRAKTFPKHDTSQILVATKKFLEENAVIRDMSDSIDNQEALGNNNVKRNMSDYDSAASQKSMQTDNKNNTTEAAISPVYDALPTPVRPPKAKKKKSPKIPEYDINTEARVAYGPPGLTPSNLKLKIVPKESLDEDIKNLEPKISEIEADEPQNRDMFDGLDSEVNIPITNKDTLKIYNEESKNDNHKKFKEESSFPKKYREMKSENNRRLYQTDSSDTWNSEEKYGVEIKYINNKLDSHDRSERDLYHKPQNFKKEEIKHANKSQDVINDNKSQSDSSMEPQSRLRSKILQRKLKFVKEKANKSDDSFSSSDIAKDSSTSIDEDRKDNTNDSDEDVESVLAKLNSEYHNNTTPKKEDTKKKQEEVKDIVPTAKNNVNPFKNLDDTISVFVDKLVTPVLMVHTKMNKRIQPCMEMRDVNFNSNIHVALANMSVKQPMMIQSVSWFTILRGFSLFMVSPLDSGKTIGYLPAVCRLVTDFKSDTLNNEGPSCIIVCATAKAASKVEKLSKMFLGLKERVLTCYTGMDELHITTALLNGCDLLICTPSILVRLMQMTDFGVDLRRLSTFVLDDCERLSEVFINEVKFFLIKIKEMLKTRANKELKVQIIAASRVWCDFMGPLAKKAPNSVLCIGAFQECVLYSKANTTVTFVKKENKINTVLDFIKKIDGSKKTVIVCREDKEVEMLEKCLVKAGKAVFACDNKMTVQDLYNLSKSLAEYQEPVLGPILVCCDGNLTQLNVTDARYLIHFSLPPLFSMFCKRFAVLNDNYPSIFKTENENIKIQVLLEDSNVEQLPKILNFIKRCTDQTPQFLDEVCSKVLAEKDAMKAKNLVPICDNLLAMGECPDFWNCQERHAVKKENDEPKEWMPKTGIITFEILHYHTATLYSARLLSNIVNGKTIKYPQTYSTLSLKMGMYYSKESNKKLHGIPEVGDVCAVSVKLNFFARCQVMKILSNYKNGKPNYVLIKLIDEEKYDRCSDVYLYYLPDELKNIETHIAQVRLVNIKPKDKDVTFSDLATNQLKKITDKQDVYMRGKVSLALGNCVLVDTLVACQDLTSLNETIVKEDFRKILLDVHAIPNPEHVPKLEKLCVEAELLLPRVEEQVDTPELVKEQLKPNWAHLDQDIDDLEPVIFATALTPDTFFVRLVKFDDCMNILIKDIEKYVKENPEPVKEVKKGDYVIAKFPDDFVYERARIDEVYNKNRVKCFFVDQGDWRDIPSTDLVKIPDQFLAQLPCQAIECRLTGVLPAGESWSDFGTNWFCDRCLEDDSDGNIKQLYVKHFTKDTAAHTDGHKYGVVLIDTNGEEDVLINQLMIDNNLAQENAEEVKYFDELHLIKPENAKVDSNTDEDEWVKVTNNNEYEKIEADPPKESLEKVFRKEPIRSMPLGQEDDDSWNIDRWDINMPPDFLTMVKNMSSVFQKESEPKVDEMKPKMEETIVETQQNNLPAIKFTTDGTSGKDSKNDVKESVAKVTPKASLNIDDLNVKYTPKKEKTSKELDSDDLSSSDSAVSGTVPEEKAQIDELRKPKIIWRQNNKNIIIKIQLIGVEKYDLEIGDRSLKFEADANDTKYGFNLELYGVVNHKNYIHSSKGQYILIILTKMLNKTWLTLTKDIGIKKWIVYDVDSIDTSSDEEDIDKETIKNVVKNMHDSESDSDDDFIDDAKF